MVEMLESRTWSDIKVGESAALTRTCSIEDIELFGVATGDRIPKHFPAAAEATVRAHSLWGSSLLSALLSSELPGPGTEYRSQDIEFLRPVMIGDTLSVTVTVVEKAPPNMVTLTCSAANQAGALVYRGIARVAAPTVKYSEPKAAPCDVALRRPHHVFEQLIDRCKDLAPVSAAVCHPCDQVSLEGAVDAGRKGIIVPILVGPQRKIRSVAEEFGLDVAGLRIVDSENAPDSAARAVALCRSGEAEVLMKGSLHTDEMMRQVANRDQGLRSGRRISHVFIMDVPSYSRTLLITDAAVNIRPTLDDKVDILVNAIELAQVLGIETPKVAILSAVETVNPKISSTLDAAALCKMADRGQIAGAVLDGPLAFDNAISAEAARIKKIVSPVAGNADILLVPDLEAGNMLAKQLSYLADADAAGIVLGARVPIVLTSRADSAKARQASAAIAVLLALARRARQA